MPRPRTQARSKVAARAFSAAFIGAVALLALLFHAGFSANPGSRVLGVLAVVEGGSLRADRWYDLTIDRAVVNGHFYSEKAPVPTMVVIPFYALYRLFQRAPYDPGDIDVIIGLGNVLAAAIPLGIFALVLQRRASLAAPPREAVWIALLAALGTPLLSYGGIYFAEVMAGLLLVLAWHFATHESHESPDAPRSALLAGLFAGLSMLSEYTMFLGVGALGLFLLTRPRPYGLKLALRYAAGGIPCALLLGALNAGATGSPFDMLYRHTTSLFYHYPVWAFDLETLHAARMLLFSEYRGLFFYAPALFVLAPLALFGAPSASRFWLLVGFSAAHFTFIASYWARYGGWCIGPRHLTPVLMVLLYEGVTALAKSGDVAKLFFVGLAAAGMAINVVAVATNPFVEGTEKPFTDLYWPALVRGEMTAHGLFVDLGLALGRAEVAVWLALFFASAALLARAAEHATRVTKLSSPIAPEAASA